MAADAHLARNTADSRGGKQRSASCRLRQVTFAVSTCSQWYQVDRDQQRVECRPLAQGSKGVAMLWTLEYLAEGWLQGLAVLRR